MKNNLSAMTVGFIFALGLGISGMTNPQKIIGFLDVFGKWDPSLIFVMLGSIVIHFFFYKIIRKRESPLFSMDWHVPKKSQVTPSLIVGSIIFGIGWGIAGYCPGPALTSLASLHPRAVIFVLGMIVGMFIFKKLDQKLRFNR